MRRFAISIGSSVVSSSSKGPYSFRSWPMNAGTALLNLTDFFEGSEVSSLFSGVGFSSLGFMLIGVFEGMGSFPSSMLNSILPLHPLSRLTTCSKNSFSSFSKAVVSIRLELILLLLIAMLMTFFSLLS